MPGTDNSRIADREVYTCTVEPLIQDSLKYYPGPSHEKIEGLVYTVCTRVGLSRVFMGCPYFRGLTLLAGKVRHTLTFYLSSLFRSLSMICEASNSYPTKTWDI